uniref:Uncharacterized protein n=1 Tax=Candidozyma auris TaxID=498019 RepID=A0A0L0P0T9_CANAR
MTRIAEDDDDNGVLLLSDQEGCLMTFEILGIKTFAQKFVII